MDKIPFDIEKFNAGFKPVYRNGEIPKRVTLFIEANESQMIVTVNANKNLFTHNIIGKRSYSDNDYDLFLLPEEETLWIAVNNKTNPEGFYYTTNATTNKDELKDMGENFTIISHTRTKQ